MTNISSRLKSIEQKTVKRSAYALTIEQKMLAVWDRVLAGEDYQPNHFGLSMTELLAVNKLWIQYEIAEFGLEEMYKDYDKDGCHPRHWVEGFCGALRKWYLNGKQVSALDSMIGNCIVCDYPPTVENAKRMLSGLPTLPRERGTA